MSIQVVPEKPVSPKVILESNKFKIVASDMDDEVNLICYDKNYSYGGVLGIIKIPKVEFREFAAKIASEFNISATR